MTEPRFVVKEYLNHSGDLVFREASQEVRWNHYRPSPAEQILLISIVGGVCQTLNRSLLSQNA
jgi:hypothetical protein